MYMANMILLRIRRYYHKHAAVRVNMIHATLGIIFGNYNEHVFPIWCMRQEFNNPSYSQVVIRFVAFAERKTGFRPVVGAMVVRQYYS